MDPPDCSSSCPGAQGCQKVKTDWKNAEGAFENKRRLHLRPSHHGIYSCPVNRCDHDGFTMERGCWKHIKSLHGCYYYFDEKPQVECQLANQNLPYLFTNLNDAEHTKFLRCQKIRKLLLDSVIGSQVKLQVADLKLKLIKLFQGH